MKDIKTGDDGGMGMIKEQNLLEQTLAIAENGYAEAYRFLVQEYEKDPASYGSQTLYFLACLAGGARLPDRALEWIQRAVSENGWWYRPEVLEDDDLAALRDDATFVALKAASDARYRDACAKAKSVFSWTDKKAGNLLIAVHGNTQNGRIAREDWQPFLETHPDWQLETVQSAEPDGYGTFRWSYDENACAPVAKAIEFAQTQGYRKLVCGGFSAGCDMLLRAVAFTSADCDALILQSPWIPVLEGHVDAVLRVIRTKGIALDIRCGSADEDCLPLAKQLHEAASAAGIESTIAIQPGCRHQFPE